MKRFKMGVFNNLHTHKVYATNRIIIYQGQKKISPPKKRRRIPTQSPKKKP